MLNFSIGECKELHDSESSTPAYYPASCAGIEVAFNRVDSKCAVRALRMLRTLMTSKSDAPGNPSQPPNRHCAVNKEPLSRLEAVGRSHRPAWRLGPAGEEGTQAVRGGDIDEIGTNLFQVCGSSNT